jgi:hypothetical protein
LGVFEEKKQTESLNAEKRAATLMYLFCKMCLALTFAGSVFKLRIGTLAPPEDESPFTPAVEGSREEGGGGGTMTQFLTL